MSLYEAKMHQADYHCSYDLDKIECKIVETFALKESKLYSYIRSPMSDEMFQKYKDELWSGELFRKSRVDRKFVL